MVFTREDILKIQNALLQLGRKDSEFKDANTPLNSNDEIAILQNGINKKVSINNLLSTLGLLKKDDFINVSDRYDEYYIQLSEAITIIAKNKRKKGLVITFQDLQGNWKIYQFNGEIEDFIYTNYWKDLFDFKYPIIDSILPDEEDLTLTYPDSNNNSFIKLKDKNFNPENFSGLGRKYLRKNIVDGVNTLTQSMMQATNTIYIIQYDFTLGEDITIPENCILEFNGGSLSGNNTIIGNNTCISASTVKILNTNITFSGTWNIVNVYPEWFGAKGDGITDDTNAIQKTIDFLHDNTLRDSYVRFRGRTYPVTNIQLKAYVNLRGEGIGSTVIKGISDQDIITIVDTNNISSIFDLSIAGNDKNIGINIIGGENFGEFGVLGGNYTKKEYPNRLKFTNIYNVTVYHCLTGILASGSSVGLFKISNIDILYCDTCISGGFIDGELSHFDLGQSRIGIDAGFGNCRITNGKVWFCSGKRETKNFSEDYFAITIAGARNIISDIDLQDCWCNGMLLKASRCLINNCIFDDAAYALDGLNTPEEAHGTNLYSDLVVTGTDNVFSNIKFAFYKTHGVRSRVLDIIKNESRNTFINITNDVFRTDAVIQGNPIVPSNTTLLVDNYNFVTDNTNIISSSYAKPNAIFKGNSIVFDFVMKTLTNGKYPIAEITTDIGPFYLYVKTYQNNIYVYLNQTNDDNSKNYQYISTTGTSMDLLNKHIRVFFLSYGLKNVALIGVVEDEKYKILNYRDGADNGYIKLIKEIKFVHTKNKVTIESLMIGDANTYLSYLYQTNYTPKICITKYSEVKLSYDISFAATRSQQKFEFDIDLTNNTFNFSIIDHHVNRSFPSIVTLYGNYYNDVIQLHAIQVMYSANNITLYYKDGKIIVVLSSTYDNLYVVNNYGPITTIRQSTEDVSELTPITIEKASQENPLNNPLYNGQSKFSSTNKKPAWWDGTNWLNSDGAVYTVNRSGTFAQKPDASKIYVGYRYFCTDKQTTEGATDGIEIIHKGNNVWVDTLGRVIS